VKEDAVLLGHTRSLVGILTDPGEAANDTNLPAVILLNAGIVHRVGPHRLYVKIARSLAAMGFTVLRFDFSGVGDSRARHDNLPFERSTISEAQDAMNYLAAERGIGRFVLAGLCSGADVSLKTACCDPRVVGAILINAQGDQLDTGDALRSYLLNRRKARYYWKSALFRPKMWLRAVRGEAAFRDIMRVLLFPLLSRVARKKKALSGPSQYAAGLRFVAERGMPLLLVFSDGDTGLDYLHEVFGDELRQLCSSGKIGFHVIPHSDHLFTLLDDKERLLRLMRDWAHGCFVNVQPGAEDDGLLHAQRPSIGGRVAGGGKPA